MNKMGTVRKLECLIIILVCYIYMTNIISFILAKEAYNITWREKNIS